MFDPDKFKGAQTRGVLAAAMGDLTGHIQRIEEALGQADDDDFSDGHRRAMRELAAEALEALFFEFEALQRISNERLR